MKYFHGMQRLAILFTLLGLTACATQQFTYLPAGGVGQSESDSRSGRAYYPVPPQSPQGNVRTATSGIVNLRSDTGGERIPAVHLQMVISNQSSATPWTVDPHAQSVAFPNTKGEVAPVFSHSKFPTEPALTVGQGEIRILDLYFPLPKDRNSASDIPEFDFHWTIQAGTQAYKETTPFDRVPLHHYVAAPYPYPYYYPSPGVYSPFYPWGFGMEWGAGPPFAVARPVHPERAPSKPVIVGH